MTGRILNTSSTSLAPARQPTVVAHEGTGLRDRLQRPLRDLRISVTDRCNFRCTYCMPREVFGADHAFLPQQQLLSFEEIVRVASIAVQMGVQKIRLTGGEPLLRKHIENLIALLAQLRTPDGQPVELAMTTNATLLAQKAQALKEAGLHRVTVSLDALDSARFTQLSDSQVAVERVLAGIEKAAEVGLAPVKVNMVVRKGINDDQIVPMARYFKGRGHALRFIEYMDVGNTNGWNMAEVITGAQIVEQLAQEFDIEAVAADYYGEVADRYRYVDGSGEFGIITSVSNPFCGDCTRMRLSPEGQFFLCLFASRGYDVRSLLRSNATDNEIAAHLMEVWHGRGDRYSELRGQNQAPREKIEMSYIGG
ncbi:GTP 3',8-cyclase MoaA [Paenalcaligenes hominis]|uniref:GTP 3',8-cyclase MoaA n=1 Tax=Paenalcaligenes hominis TaxID=643674 RepID=UPI0035261A9F